MARRKQLAITERQFEVLNLLWEHGPLTVREIREQLVRAVDLPYTTVLGLLQVMERERLVVHEQENQAHRFRPLLSRSEGTSQLLVDFVRRFFSGAAARLVLGLVDARQLSAEDLRELESQLAARAEPLPGKAVKRRATPPSKNQRKKP